MMSAPTAPPEMVAVWPNGVLDAEPHIYSAGGHEFGIEPQGLLSDAWIDQFHTWPVVEGLTSKETSQ
jgi:hypothetical protein